jgi:hypothetical protein
MAFLPVSLPQLPLGQFEALVPLLQASLSPVTVISGVGLLLLSMSNRYGRIIDQVRSMLASKNNYTQQKYQGLGAEPLAVGLPRPNLAEQTAIVKGEQFLLTQLQILYRRARIVRWSITFALLSLYLVSLTIVLLFSGLLFQFNLSLFTGECFLLALIMLLASMSLFIVDISISLRALKLELNYHHPEAQF